MDPGERKRVEMERRGRLMRGESLSELRALTEEELHEKYNALMELTSAPNINRDAQMRYVARARVYADELVRRETERQGKRMEKLTTSMYFVGWVGVAVAVVGVVLSVLTLLANV